MEPAQQEAAEQQQEEEEVDFNAYLDDLLMGYIQQRTTGNYHSITTTI